MGRQQVVQINCDRCTRVEHRPLKDMPPEGEFAFRGIFLGEKLEYQDLCSGCEEIVRLRWKDIQRELQQRSPIRQKKEGKKTPPPPPKS